MKLIIFKTLLFHYNILFGRLHNASASWSFRINRSGTYTERKQSIVDSVNHYFGDTYGDYLQNTLSESVYCENEAHKWLSERPSMKLARSFRKFTYSFHEV